MATYKVLQDIEAEDTLVGPLTLRQCIYAAIAVLAGYLSFIVISKGAAFLVIFLLPFMAFGVFFAFPWSKQQSTEVWALAKVRFYFKPRKRIWNQSGVKQLVTITAPKNTSRSYTSNLSPTEVESRLKALADTIDSRGWAIKNVDLGYYTHPSVSDPANSSDRLIDASNLQPAAAADYQAAASADIFDVQNNPVAQKFDIMMSQSAGAHRQQLVQQLNQQAAAATAQGSAPVQGAAVPASYWHLRTIDPATTAIPAQTPPMQSIPPVPPMSAPANTTTGAGISPAMAAQAAPYATPLPTPIAATPSANPAAAAQPAPLQPPAAASPAPPIDYASLRMPNAQSAAPYAAMQPSAAAAQPSVTAPTNPAILELANNNDLNVATIAREAHARNPDPPDEVVVSFH